MASIRPDYSLYLCMDRKLMSCNSVVECVYKAVKGGVTVVQLREKELCGREFYELGLEVKAVTDRFGVPLIINDRLDIALAIGADGVHLGQSDLPVSVAKRLMGDKIVGATVHNLKEALSAQSEGADYLGVGAMFGTATKKDAKVISPDELDAIKRAATVPIVLIGGINRDNVIKLKGKGDGIAVVSAIVSAPDITEAARELKSIWK